MRPVPGLLGGWGFGRRDWGEPHRFGERVSRAPRGFGPGSCRGLPGWLAACAALDASGLYLLLENQGQLLDKLLGGVLVARGWAVEPVVV